MKLFISLLTLCILTLFSQSCTKEIPVPVTDTLIIRHIDTLYLAHPTSINGLWIGTYDVTGGSDAGRKDFYYSFELHKDSTIQVISVGGDGETYYGLGTWSLQNETEFSAHFTTTNLVHTGVAQTAAGTYDSTNRKLSGTVTNDSGPFYQATFDMEKVE